MDIAPGAALEDKEQVVIDLAMDVGDAVTPDMALDKGRDSMLGRVPGAAGDDEGFEARLTAMKQASPAAPTPAKSATDVDRLGASPFGGDRTAGTIVNDDARARRTAAADEEGGGSAASKGLAFGLAIIFVVATGLYSLSDLASGAFNSSVAQAPAAQEQALSATEREQLLGQVASFEGRLAADSGDAEAQEGLAVAFVELGKLDRAEAALDKLTALRPDDPEVLRLLGEVRLGLGKAAEAAQAYESAADASVLDDIDVLQGLTDARIAEGKPGEAVRRLRVAKETSATRRASAAASAAAAGLAEGVDGTVLLTGADATQIDLLLGKAYAAWDKPGDALVLFEGIIKSNSKDWRGYLAKGGLLRDLGKSSEAEKAFFLAKAAARAGGGPEAEAVVDRVISRR